MRPISLCALALLTACTGPLLQPVHCRISVEEFEGTSVFEARISTPGALRGTFVFDVARRSNEVVLARQYGDVATAMAEEISVGVIVLRGTTRSGLVPRLEVWGPDDSLICAA